MGATAGEWDEHRFWREAGLLALFCGIAVVVLRPTPTVTWVGNGALLGAAYWTLMYHGALAGVRERFPGSEGTNAIWSFVIVAIIVEFVGSTPTVKGGLVLGYAAGVCCAGLVAAARRRVLARLRAAGE